VEISVDYLGGMSFKATCGEHDVMIDLPQAFGGSDKAATPLQLFLSSLASCVGVYVASYAKNAGLNAKGMQIKINADKMQNPARLDNIKMIVSMPNAQVGERRNAIFAVAKKCLIHNTLSNHPKMEIDLESDQGEFLK